MNKHKLLISLVFVLSTFSLSTGNVSAETATDITARISDRIQRHKNRKAAADHLKIRAEEAQHKRLFNADGTPKGYKSHGFTGIGRSGHGKNKNKRGVV